MSGGQVHHADTAHDCTKHSGHEAMLQGHETRIHETEDGIGTIWKAIDSIRVAMHNRPSWLTCLIIAVLTSSAGYLYARNDDARTMESRVSIELVRMTARIDSLERTLIAAVNFRRAPQSMADPGMKTD